jgi:hypothetical protein
MKSKCIEWIAMVIAMVIGRDLALSSMEGSRLCWNRFRFRHLCSTSSYVVKFAANMMPKRKTTFFRMITDIYFAKDLDCRLEIQKRRKRHGSRRQKLRARKRERERQRERER